MTPKVKHHFVEKTTAFLDTIGLKHPRNADQYHMAHFWTRNQEQIVKHIAGFCGNKPRIYAGYLRMFGILSESAQYLNQLKTTEPCKA